MAFQWLQREAGVFEAPPATLAKVLRASWGIYASHILDYAESMLERTDKLKPFLKDMVVMEESLANVAGVIGRVGPGKIVRLPGGPSYDIGIKRISDEHHEQIFDRGEPPLWWILRVRKGKRLDFPRMPRWDDEDWDQKVHEEFLSGVYEENTTREVLTRYLEKGLAEYKNTVPPEDKLKIERPEQRVDLELLRKECLKYTDKAKSYKKEARTQIPVDLTGWKYLVGVDPVTARERLDLAGLTQFTLVLEFFSRKDRGGQWTLGNRQMELGVSDRKAATVAEFRKGIQNLERIARHETQHVGQDVLRIIKGLPEDAGLPSAEIRETDADVWGFPPGSRTRIEHGRRDVEFYTRLADDVVKFKKEFEATHPRKRRNLFKTWIQTSDFFKAIKTNKPKWQKAVGEFYKALEEEGIAFGKEQVSYKPDMNVVREESERDSAAEMEEAKKYGEYDYWNYQLLPIDQVKPLSDKSKRLADRIKEIRGDILAGRPLPPVKVDVSGKGYLLVGGDEFYWATVESEFKKIPALVRIIVKTPEDYSPPDPEKPKLKEGDWVRIKEDQRRVDITSPWAQVSEFVYSDTDTNLVTDEIVPRHTYALLGLENGEAAFLGDWRDNHLEVGVGQPPSDVKRELEMYSGMGALEQPAARVANRWVAK